MLNLLLIPAAVLFLAFLALWLLWRMLKLAWKSVRWLWRYLITVPRANKRFVRGFRQQPPMGKSDFHNYEPFRSTVRKLKLLGERTTKREGGPIWIFFTKKYRGFRAHKPFLVMSNGPDVLMITPCRYWAFVDDSYSVGQNTTLRIAPLIYRKRTRDRPEEARDIRETTWEYTTKSGEPDLRYKDNPERFIIRRYGFTLYLHGNRIWRVTDLTRKQCAYAINGFVELSGAEPIEQSNTWDNNRDDSPQNGSDGGESPDDNQEKGGQRHASAEGHRPWHEVLGVSPSATQEQIVAARNKRVHELHPDRLEAIEGLAPEFRKLANDKLAEVNVAYQEAMGAKKQTRNAPTPDVQGFEDQENQDAEADPLYDEAARIVLESRNASISGVQRRLKIGYNRAARMIEEMEAAGIVGPLQGDGMREVLMPPPPRDL